MANGALCVMIRGAFLMPMWCATSSVTMEPHLHLELLPLVKALVQSTMTMLNAQALNHAWLTAPAMALEITIVFTVKMQELSATLHQVSEFVLT